MANQSYKTPMQSTMVIWNLTIWNPETFEIQISNGPVLKCSGFSYDYSYNPNHLKMWTFLSGFQMVFDKMASICPDFKLLGFWFSDPI